jgi:hypothetical protein
MKEQWVSGANIFAGICPDTHFNTLSALSGYHEFMTLDASKVNYIVHYLQISWPIYL